VPRSGAGTAWPSRSEVQAFARACDEAIIAALSNDELPVEGLYTALEHEAMHQETLLYMWHRLPYEQKHRDPSAAVRGPFRGNPSALAELPASVVVPRGIAHLGADRRTTPFGWDNEFDAHEERVPEFEVDVLPVTNAQFLEFMNAGGYQDRALWSDEGWEWIQAEEVQHPAFWLPDSDLGSRPPSPRSGFGEASDLTGWRWRGMFDEIPLPAAWPVYVSHAEATAYARWTGRRLMTEAEFDRAAYGDDRAQPWGHEPPDGTRGHFDFAGFDPVPVGSFPGGASVWGVRDLVGNGWEWTSTVFGPFDGFTPMASYPEYSADFFDGRHYVMKGASPATAKELIRRSFRNWFRGNYPYVYAKFRTAR